MNEKEVYSVLNESENIELCGGFIVVKKGYKPTPEEHTAINYYFYEYDFGVGSLRDMKKSVKKQIRQDRKSKELKSGELF